MNDYAVSNLFFDSGEDLWIGMTTGLAKFDGNYITHYIGEGEVSRNNPTRLGEDDYGNIWVGSKDGLYRLDKKQNTITHFTAKQGLPQNDISSLISDHMGRIWITYNQGGYSVISIQTSGSQFEYKIDNYNANATFNLNLVQQVIETKNNRICIVTEAELIQIKNEDLLSNSMYAIVYNNEDTYTGFNTSIAEDQNGRIWLAGLSGMAMLEAKNADDLNYITRDEYSNQKIKASMTCMIIDRDDYLWIGHAGIGINRIKINSPFNSIKEDFGLGGAPSGPVEDKWGNIWFYIHGKGLFCLKKALKERPSELLNFKVPLFDNSQSPQSMIIDNDNTIWLCMRWQLFKIELFQKGESITVKQFGEEEGFPAKTSSLSYSR